MTTPAETIAQAIRDGFHELATAVNRQDAATSPGTGLGTPDSPSRGESDGEPPASASQGVVERAARVLADTSPYFYSDEYWTDEAQALADAGLLADANPQPMTVGQLGAQHLGKRIHVGENTGPGALRVGRITHWRTSTVLTHGYASPMYPHDTPCTVEPDHD